MRQVLKDQFEFLFFYMPAPLINIVGLTELKMVLFIEPPRGIQAFEGPQIYFRIFWGLTWNSANWESMEEASEILNTDKSNKSSLQSAMEPFSAIKWFASKSPGTTIKIIITNDDALYINLGELKKTEELYKVLKERIRFIK